MNAYRLWSRFHHRILIFLRYKDWNVTDCTEWYKSALASRRESNQIRISEGNQFSRISFLPFSSYFWAGHCGHYRFYPSEDQSWRKHIFLHECETKLKTTPVMCGFRKICEISDYLSYVFSTFLQFSFVVGSKAWSWDMNSSYKLQQLLTVNDGANCQFLLSQSIVKLLVSIQRQWNVQYWYESKTDSMSQLIHALEWKSFVKG